VAQNFDQHGEKILSHADFPGFTINLANDEDGLRLPTNFKVESTPARFGIQLRTELAAVKEGEVAS